MLLAVAGSACSGRFGAPRPASSQGSKVLGLWRVLFLTGAVVGALVLGLIFWCLLRYRRRGDGGQGAAFFENVPLELAYTAAPLLLVGALFALAMVATRDVNHLAAEPDLRVEVTGFQWGWRFRYLTQNVTIVGTGNDPPTLVLPRGETVRLTLRSPDVIHSFYVPDFLEKRDVIPGVENRLDVKPTRAGRYGGFCAEFCGLDHARMTFTVEVVEPPQFQAFVTQQQQQAPQPTTPPGTQGGNYTGRQAGPAPLPPGVKVQ